MSKSQEQNKPISSYPLPQSWKRGVEKSYFFSEDKTKQPFFKATNSYLISDFVEIQRKSFFELLETGLIEEFSKRNPITNKNLEIFFYPEYFQLTPPEYNPRRAILLSKSYSSKLFVPAQLTDKKLKKSQLKWVLIGNLPLMTKRGHFVLNGAPRVIVNQILRSPGIYFQGSLKEIFSDKWSEKPEITYKRFYTDLICLRGTWLRIEIDKNKDIWAQMKKVPKIPLLWFLLAMGLTERIIFKSVINPTRLLANFNLDIKRKIDYEYVTNAADAWKEISNLISPKQNNSLLKKKKLSQPLTPLAPFKIEKGSDNSGSVSLINFAENAKEGRNWIFKRFMNPRAYDLGKQGRLNFNRKLGLTISSNQTTLTAQDLLFATDYLLKVETGLKNIDDIDHLKNRRVRTSGELLQIQIGIGLVRLEKIIREKFSKINAQTRASDFLISRPNNPKIKSSLLFAKQKKIHLKKPNLKKKKCFFQYNLAPHTLFWVNRFFSINKCLSPLSPLYPPSLPPLLFSFPPPTPPVGVKGGEPKGSTLGYYPPLGVPLKEGFSFAKERVAPLSLPFPPPFGGGKGKGKQRIHKGGEEVGGVKSIGVKRGIAKRSNPSLKKGENLSMQSIDNSSLNVFYPPHYIPLAKLTLQHGLLGRSPFKKKRAILNLRGGKGKGVKKISQATIFYKGATKVQKTLNREVAKLNNLINTKAFNGALREFFGTSQLSQFMDQLNPLAEITHKRRLSSMGPGGVTRDSATLAIRGIHPTHYGRICPIETPEGKNTGLVNSLTTYARASSQGFLESPFYKVYKGQIQKNAGIFFLSAEQEEHIKLAAADVSSPSGRIGFLPKSKMPAKVAYGDTISKISRNIVEYIGVSPIQMISIATSLIPFLEHDDANRALMGSNMQRQAVPLIRAERPLVGTGLESRAVSDSGHAVIAKESGYVAYVSAKKIVIYTIPLHN